jgi:hypothetical protein
LANPAWNTTAWRKRRAELIRAAIGTPCPSCGNYLNPPGVGPPWTQRFHLDHEIPRAMGGVDGPVRIVHAFCNTSAGGRLGARLRRKAPKEHEWKSRW